MQFYLLSVWNADTKRHEASVFGGDLKAQKAHRAAAKSITYDKNQRNGVYLQEFRTKTEFLEWFNALKVTLPCP